MRKAHSGTVRRISHGRSNQVTTAIPNFRLPTVKAKSLFINILEVNYLFSIFWETSIQSDRCNQQKQNELWHRPQNRSISESYVNSLLFNILLVSCSYPIFYGPKGISKLRNSLKKNNLYMPSQKLTTDTQSDESSPEAQNGPTLDLRQNRDKWQTRPC
jgi:hypothetical protein